jgi:hypothetical protein
MIGDGQLKPGRYICATPCFRDEPVIDELHREYFFKVELINTIGPFDEDGLLDVVNHAMELFKLFGLDVGVITPENVPLTSNDCDIVTRQEGIELGSYGIREAVIYDKNIQWIYGTGVAEPRTSIALKKLYG